MKILKILGLIVLVLIIVAGALVIIMPTNFSLERSVVIEVPKDILFENVRMFSKYEQWNPWAELDTNMTTNISGEDGNVGAVYSWSGNNKVGKGSETITSISDNRIDIALKFSEPWVSDNETYFNLSEESTGTKVAWGMTGHMPRPMNAFGIFMNMKELISKDYDKGLSKLKTVTEKFVADHTRRGFLIKELTIPEKFYISFRSKVKFSEMSKFYAKYFPMIANAIQKADLKMNGAPSGIYYQWDQKNMVADMAAGIPMAKDTTLKGFVTQSVAGKALQIAYFGSYDKSAEAYYALDDYMKENGLQMNNLVFEEYITDPMTEPDTSKWLTNIYYLVK